MATADAGMSTALQSAQGVAGQADSEDDGGPGEEHPQHAQMDCAETIKKMTI